MSINAAVLYRVSTDEQHTENQKPDVGRFVSHHDYNVTNTYEIEDSAYDMGDDSRFRALMRQIEDDAWQGKFRVLIVWALDRLTREGAEAALRAIRRLRERGCVVVSVQESWLNGSPEIQDVLVAFAGWQAQQESKRRSSRIRNGLARKRAAGEPVGGRKPGARDKRPRKVTGYSAAWAPGGARREARNAAVTGGDTPGE